MKLTKEEILEMHLGGKLNVELLRDLKTQKDLSIAYTPGVAEVCKTIVEDPDSIYKYTMKGNLVGVVTDGTAVLGLGDIGPRASIPVMEGKAVLFKAFGKVDSWPVPLENVRVNGNTGKSDINKVVEVTASLACMYGGINLEDIAAPACFDIEEKLQNMLDIPVFHDDQWGTAVITLAGVKNYCLLSGKAIEELNIVINGAGAAGIRIADMLKLDGARNIIMVDSKGVVHSKRDDLNKYKMKYAVDTTKRTLEDAMNGADVFIGVSIAGCLKPEMVKSMKEYPALFAMANPVPEIMPDLVKEVMGDKKYVMATGRSDFANQVNNVLGFPFIFRGALDIRASKISMKMKQAASEALAELAREGNVPEDVKKAYNRTDLDFGPTYIIPVPFDPRLLERESNAVAKAAFEEGISKYNKTINKSDIKYCLKDYESRNAVLKDLAYYNGECFVGVDMLNQNQIVYVPCDKKWMVWEKEGITLYPQQEPGKFFRLASKCIGKEVGFFGTYVEKINNAEILKIAMDDSISLEQFLFGPRKKYAE